MGRITEGFAARDRSVALSCALLAAGLCAWQLALPGHLLGVTEYDDGVYLGATVRLVSGALPYRDVVFVQPQGIVVLMAPVALPSRAVGTASALGVARVLTALVTALDAGLVAWLVRARGRFAMAAAGGGLALFPLAVAADQTLLLEPYLVAFVLGGSLVAFGREAPSRWRLLVAGALFGAAGAVKLWAVFPFLALAGCLLLRDGRRAAWLVAGAAAGFGVLAGPFAALAPVAFVHEVLLDQLGRSAAGVADLSVRSRLAVLAGLSGFAGLPDPGVLGVVLFAALGLLVAAAAAVGRAGWGWLDTYLVTAAALSVAGLLAAPELYPHYAFFTARLLVAVAAVSATILVNALRSPLTGSTGVPRSRAVGRAAVACGLAVAVGLVANDVAYDARFLPALLRGPNGAVAVDPGPAIARMVPAGACVVFDDPVLALEADRFTPARPGCPAQVDPYGMWLADGARSGPSAYAPPPARLVATWRAGLGVARAVVLTSPSSGYVPWTPALRSWFDRHFRQVLVEQDAAVYIWRAARRRAVGERHHHYP